MDELARSQLVVMGRRTYELWRGFSVEADGRSWGRTAELDKVLFSRMSPTTWPWPYTWIWSRDLVEEVQQMKVVGLLPSRTWASWSLARQLLSVGLGGLGPDRRPFHCWPGHLGVTGLRGHGVRLI